MADPRRKQLLIIGASSELARQFVKFHNDGKYDYIGISSKVRNEPLTNGSFLIYGYHHLKELSQLDIDIILILASHLPSTSGNIEDYLDVNKKVLETVGKLKKPESIFPKIIFTSTFSVYSSDVSIINEKTPTTILSSYAESKILLEKELSKFADQSNYSLLMARIPVFAYCGGTTNFLAKLIKATRENESFTMFNRNQFLSAVFDVNCLVDLVNSNWSGTQIVNCASAGDITFDNIALLALRHGLKEVLWMESERPSQYVDITKVSSLLGYTPSAKQIVERLFRFEFCDSNV